MEKPISIKIEELKQSVEQLIIKSELPVYIVEPIIKDICNELVALKQQQLNHDIEFYKEQEQNEKVKNKKEEKKK